MIPSHLFIIAAHRAGSTSIFRYLNAHDGVLGCFKKELHYFTSGVYDGNYSLDRPYYQQHFPEGPGICMEGSPSYLYGGKKLALFLKSNFDRPKVMLILRNPTDRFFSFYLHSNSRTPPAERFKIDHFIEQSLMQYESGKVIDNFVNRGIREGVYADHIGDWLEVFGKDLQLISFDDLKHNPKSVVKKSLNFLGLKSDNRQLLDLKIHNQTSHFNSFRLHKMAMNVNESFERFLGNQPKTKQVIKTLYSLLNSKPLEQEIPQGAKDKVAAFYQSHNARLRTILEENKLPTPKWTL